MAEPADPELVEIYHTSDPLEADVIRDEVLVPNGVDCQIRDRTSHPFNTPTMSGGFYIAVPKTEAEKARTLLKEAREVQTMSTDGDFV